MSKAFALSVDQAGIARLVFDLPGEKVNKLTRAVLSELGAIVAEVRGRAGVRALVLSSAKKDIFVAGADLAEIAGLRSPADAEAYARLGQGVFQALSDLPFPTLAVVDGAALGGGLELALACDFRLASDNPKAVLGLPEVTLGLIPGYGGTQRLPRLIGLESALERILTGAPVDGKKAAALGLAEVCIRKDGIAPGLGGFLQGLGTEEGRRRLEARRARMAAPVEGAQDADGLFSRAEGAHVHRASRGHNPAPGRALETIRRTFRLPLREGLDAEAVAFGTVAVEPAARNLIHLFFLRERIKKDPQAPAGAEPAPVARAAVLGAGVMGSGIAWLFSNGEIRTLLKDVTPEIVQRGISRAEQNYADLKKIGKIGDEEMGRKMAGLSGVTDYAGIGETDLVVEAVVEDLDVKRKVFAEVEPLLRPDAILASNTSTLSITEMARGLSRPERFVGLHFFNPVNRMPLVEVIPGERTSPRTLATAVALSKKLGKTPIVVQSCVGFLANRILFPYLDEAMILLDEGADLERMDRAVTDFGMPMGPLTLMDEIGLDVCLHISRILEGAYGERMRTPALLGAMVEGKRLAGRKQGKGFYLHEGKTRRPNPEALETVAASRRAGAAAPISDQEISDRILLAMLNECARCLEEKVIERADYLDLALQLGFGFPPARGGLLRWADDRGISSVVSRLAELSRAHGPRFEPCGLLREMAAENRAFYPA